MALRRQFEVDLDEPLFKVADLARFAQLSQKTIYRAVELKDIECLRLGPDGDKGGIRFTRKQVKDWLMRRTQAAEF